MAAKTHDQLSSVVREVEALAKRLRGDIRNAARATGFERQVRSAAKQLRKQAAHAAEQVEKYAHRLRVDLEGSPRKRAARKRPIGKRAA